MGQAYVDLILIRAIKPKRPFPSGDRILVVGAGDPRHLVTTLAGNTGNTSDTNDTSTTGNVTEFFLLEQNLHVYCRQVSGTIKFGISCKLVNVFSCESSSRNANVRPSVCQSVCQ